jgi:type VII secretion protein EccE
VTVATWTKYRGGKTARHRALCRAVGLSARDVPVTGGSCGVRRAGSVFVSMIQLSPNLDMPTVIAEAGNYTEDVVPVAMLATMLDQFGVQVDIDIAAVGRRVRTDATYGMLYQQLIGRHPVVGDRQTWLVVRVDGERNRTVLAKRGSVEQAAMKAVAAAAVRISARLRERGVVAHPLPAEHLSEASKWLHIGVNPDYTREMWSRIEIETDVPGVQRAITTFIVDPAHLDSASLEQCWSYPSDYTTITVSLSTRESDEPTGRSGVGVWALVRYLGAPMDEPPLPQLRLLGGRQSQALLATLPADAAAHMLGVAGAKLDDTGAMLAIPIGPSGQILGAISGNTRHALAVPLFDPTRFNPRRRTIDVHAQLAVAQQLVLRAAAVGAGVEIHTSRPQHWQQLVGAVGDPRAVRMATPHNPNDPPRDRPTIAVFDGVLPSDTGVPTVMALAEPGARPPMQGANLAINQVDASTVTVGMPKHTVKVDLVGPPGETRYLAPTGAIPPENPGAPASGPFAGGATGGGRSGAEPPAGTTSRR